MEQKTIYEELGLRTNGAVLIGVTGPTRTGKSTFVKRLMEELVIPNISDVYRRERAKDELPQSGSGRTIMTSEPKFVPEEAVEISPDGVTKLAVRMIDSVGYMIPGAVGASEDGAARMVTTPWFDYEIPMAEAAEIGTKKVMEDHSTIGVVVTTDGSITDIPRADYEEAEARAIRDMQATKKPFVVLLNSEHPEAEETTRLREQLAQSYGVNCIAVNCLSMSESEIANVLRGMLYEFPVCELRFFMPRWVESLPLEHQMKNALFEAMRRSAASIGKISEIEPAMREIAALDALSGCTVQKTDLGTGVVSCVLDFPEQLFYEVLSETCGFPVKNDGDLMALLQSLAEMKRSYDKVSAALEQVQATGYGIVMPTPAEMRLEEPEIVRRGGNYAVKLRASAPSIHMIRTDIQTEISPIVGDEKQSEDLVHYLLGEYEDNTQKLWESNIFGKSLYELVNEGLGGKLTRIPDESRYKFRDALTRIINEGSNGLICIIL